MRRWPLFILILAFFLRLILITQSFWMDEAAQALESMRPFSQQLHIAYDFQPPLMHLLVFFMVRISRAEWWLRMVSVIAGVVTVGFTNAIGRKIGESVHKKSLAEIAALLLAASTFHIYFSQELRSYALAAMWATISWWALFHWEQESRQKKWGVWFTLSTIAGLYTMYVYPFVVMAQGLYVFFHKRNMLRQYGIALGMTILAFLPWLPSFLQQLHLGTTLQKTLPGWQEVVSSPQWKALPLVWLKFIGGVELVKPTIFDIVYFGIPTILFIYLVLSSFKHQKSQFFALLWWSGGSVLLTWVVSFIVPVISPKRVMIALPAIYLLYAYGIVQLKSSLQKIIVGMLIAFQCIGLGLYWTTPLYQRENWREVIAGFHQQFSPENTIVLFGFNAPFAPWTFYEQRYVTPFPTLSLIVQHETSKPIQTINDIDASMQKVLVYQHVLIFDYLRDLTDPHRTIESWLEQHGYKGVNSLETNNIGFIREYEK